MICENCGKEHNGSYASGRFCCKECAKAFSSKHVNKSPKEAKCISCGKIIYISRNASNKTCKCDKCKNQKTYYCEEEHKYKHIKYSICKICGRLKNENNECENDFCKYHNYQHFKSLIKYFGFDKTKLGTIEVENEFNRIRNILYDLYWNKNLSSTQLAEKFNYKSTPTNITQKFFKNYLNIPVKTVRYSVLENIMENRQTVIGCDPKYKFEWHTTWNNKEVFLRSSYETDYANELDKNKINYDVESLRIKYWNSRLNEYHCAIPDFYLPDTNTIVEIKSDYTLDIQEMKDKVKAYKDLGYNFKLILNHQETDLYTL